MNLFFAVCAVILILLMGALAFLVLRLVKGLERAEDEFSKTMHEVRDTARGFREVAERSKGVVHTIEESLQSSADLVHELTARMHQISSTVLDEVEPPVRSAVALAKGVRAGADMLAERLWSRVAGRRAEHNGEEL